MAEQQAQQTQPTEQQQYVDMMNALPVEIRVLVAALTQIHASLVRIEGALANGRAQ